MCSTPKGQSGHARAKISVGSVSSSLSAEQYTEMVQRSNLAYERRQRRLVDKKQIATEVTEQMEQPVAAKVDLGGFNLIELLKKWLQRLLPVH